MSSATLAPGLDADEIVKCASASAPALSVVLCSPDILATQWKTLSYLAAQTVRGRIEAVLVSPSLDDLDAVAPWLERLHSYRLVQSPMGAKDYGAQVALGFRAARAPLVAVGEDHCSPAPGWGEAILKAFDRPERYAAVHPALHHANDGVLGRVNNVLDYLDWVAPIATGEARHLSLSNAVYRRDVALEACGDRLAELIGPCGAVFDVLHARGERFLVASDARVYHQNVSTRVATIRLRFMLGRYLAAKRSSEAGCGVVCRAIAAARAPAEVASRFVKVLRRLRRRGHPTPTTFVLATGASLAVEACGRVTGHALGAGRSGEAFYDFEFHRERFVHPHERGRDWVAECEPAAVVAAQASH